MYSPLVFNLARDAINHIKSLAKKKNGQSAELTYIDKALILLTRNPNQSTRGIAQQVGCTHSWLSKNERFKRMRQSLAGRLAKGTKTKGYLEAEEWDENEDEDD